MISVINQKNNNNNNMPLVVGILIFDQVELLDVAGPFEVFSTTHFVNEQSKNKKESSSSSPACRVLRNSVGLEEEEEEDNTHSKTI